MATDMEKTTAQRDHYIVHNLKKRCIKRRFTGIHDRFLKDPEFRASPLEHDRDEESLHQNGRSCRQRFLSLHDGIRIFPTQTKLVDLS